MELTECHNEKSLASHPAGKGLPLTAIREKHKMRHNFRQPTDVPKRIWKADANTNVVRWVVTKQTDLSFKMPSGKRTRRAGPVDLGTG